MEEQNPSASPTRFGWVGLGQMGYPMARQLVRGLRGKTKDSEGKTPGFEFSVYDIDRGVCEKFVKEMTEEVNEEGAGGVRIEILRNAREVSENSDCFFSIVPEGSHVKDVYLTPETGALATNTSGKLFIDCSTIDIPTSLLVGSAVHSSSSALFFDAPVSGGTIGASKGTLTFMLGCSPSHPSLPLLHSILSPMGTSIKPIGAPSLGLAAKLSNNYLSSLITLATAEAMNLGMHLGMDPHVLSGVFKTSSGGSWVNDICNPVPGVCPEAPASKGYEGGFKVQLMRKDLGLAIKAAEGVGARLVLGQVGLGAYEAAAADERCRDRDARVIYRWLGGVEPE